MASEDDILLTGKGKYPIEAFGTVEINVDTPRDPETILLLNVALAPGFLTNLICLRRMTEKGIRRQSDDSLGPRQI